jgi:phosphoglycerate kinase
MLSHLGRPNGKKDLKYTMRPVADYLEKSLGRKVTFL